MTESIDNTLSHKPLSLRANISWTFVGNAVYAACQWGMVAVIAKLTTPADVGQFAIGLAVTAPVFMFTNLQLRGVQATDARADYAFPDYLGLRLLTTALGLAAVIGIVLAVGFPRETALIVALLGFAKAVESLSDVIYGLLQQREQMDRIARSLMVRGPLSLVVLVGVLTVSGSLPWAVAGLGAIWLGVLLTHDRQSGRLVGASFVPRWEWSTLASLAWLALPLGLVMMLVSLNVNLPRYLIELELGARELGIFAALSYVVIAGGTVVAALGQSAAPRLSQHYAAGRLQAFRRLLWKLVGIGVGLGLGGVGVAMALGGPLLRALYTSEYAEHQPLFVMLMGVAAVSYVASFLGYGLTAARSFRPQLPIFTLAAAVTLVVGWWAIPMYGLYGAAGALLASALVQGLGCSFALRHALRVMPARPSSVPTR